MTLIKAEPRPDQLIRELRGPKPSIDPYRPLDVVVERERGPSGEEDAVTVFFAGSECPFTCVFCDLWQHTLDEATPSGALPLQLEQALKSVGEDWRGGSIKLYNASNFFDARAVPVEDEDALVELCKEARRVVVECHPKLVGERCFRFAEKLGGKRLQVAMGLETVHPEALPRLNKQMTLEDFNRAAQALAEHQIELRAFVLIGVPFIAREDQVEWAERSVAHAFECGASVVSLIPVRGGNGELERLAAQGDFEAPTLTEVEEAFDRALALEAGIVQLDTWDLDRLGGCLRCTSRRLARLARMSLTGEIEPRVGCRVCAGIR